MDKPALDELEAKGPAAVLLAMARGGYGDPGSRTREDVEAWLRSKSVETEAAASAKRDAREEETLSIARTSLSISRRANNIAVIAMILAATATIVSAIIAIWDPFK